FRMTRSRPLRRLAPFPTRRSSDLHPLAELAQLLRRDRLAEPLLDGIEKLRLQHDQQLPLRIRRAFESEDVAQTEEPRRKILQKRSEEHTSELQSREKLVCRLLLEK